jgi:hypothetical protein
MFSIGTHASSVGERGDLSNRAMRQGSDYGSGEESEAAEVGFGPVGLVLDHALERFKGERIAGGDEKTPSRAGHRGDDSVGGCLPGHGGKSRRE